MARCDDRRGSKAFRLRLRRNGVPAVALDISAAIYAPRIVIAIHHKDRPKVACGSISEGSRFAAAELENLAVK
jgi:hypothetical protein